MSSQRMGVAMAAAAVVAALATTVATAATGQAGSNDSPAHSTLDPTFGVCRGLDPACYHRWYNFDPAKNGYRVLLYTATPGPRHADLGPALGPGLDPPLAAANVVQNAVIRLGQQNNFQVDWTEDVTQLENPAGLFKYNAILFFTSRTALDDAAQTALRIYLEGGGGFAGIHNAFGTEYNWNWYLGLLGGAQLYDHGPEQTATVHVTDPRDPSMMGVPATWTGKDEWYNLTAQPSDVRILQTVDEKSMPTDPPTGYYGEPGMGALHPVTWCQYYDGGRAWLTTLGHDAGDWQAGSAFPGAADFQSTLVGGIEAVMGATPFCR